MEPMYKETQRGKCLESSAFHYGDGPDQWTYFGAE